MPFMSSLYNAFDPGTEMTSDVTGALLEQLKKSIMGTDPTAAMSMGMPGLAGLMAGRGPQVQVPQNLQRELGGGFRQPGSSLGKPSVLQSRNPAGRPDIPSWDAMASTEAPAARNALGELIKRLTRQ